MAQHLVGLDSFNAISFLELKQYGAVFTVRVQKFVNIYFSQFLWCVAKIGIAS